MFYDNSKPHKRLLFRLHVLATMKYTGVFNIILEYNVSHTHLKETIFGIGLLYAIILNHFNLATFFTALYLLTAEIIYSTK